MKVWKTDDMAVPVKSWCPELEPGAQTQIENAAKLPFAAHHVALMPDAHQGYGAPIQPGGEMNLYILDEENQPHLTYNQGVWAQWWKNASRVVAKDTVGEARISTIFLGIDHNFKAGGPPILWETMIFGGPLDCYVERYSSQNDALTGHIRALLRAKKASTNG